MEHRLEGQLDAPVDKKGTDCGNEGVGWCAHKALKDRIDLTAGASPEHLYLQPHFTRNSLHVTHRQLGIHFAGWVDEQGNTNRSR